MLAFNVHKRSMIDNNFFFISVPVALGGTFQASMAFLGPVGNFRAMGRCVGDEPIGVKWIQSAHMCVLIVLKEGFKSWI